MSLERAEDLAFEGRLDAADAALGRIRGSLSSTDRARWLRAYLAAVRGDFGRAERNARAILSNRGLDYADAARTAITLGSVLRQTGRHADARAIERAALARCRSGPSRTHLLIGLVADAVGMGDLRAVDAALRRIDPRPPGGWRAAVRLRWVRCERELLAGRPREAARHARRALETSERAGARRHAAKSLLFLGAAFREAGAQVEADRALRRARAIATRIGARPIAEVSDDLLGRPRARR